jgi:uncharacterized iron-regulated protein
MKITIYELLGMIKDGKAPKKIKIDNDILTLSEINIIQYNFERSGQLNWDYYIENYRLDEKVVEILDKDFKLEEKKIPEKLDIRQEKNIKNNWKWKVYGKEHSYNISTPQKIIADKLNEVIDYLHYLKSKGE